MARVTNLQELQAEKRRLQAELELQKAIITYDVERVKKKFDVIGRIKAFFGAGNERGSAPPALKATANIGIDIIGGKILKRAGWIARLVLPLLAKRFSSSLLDKYRAKKQKLVHG
jgi:hypothetical protein